MSASEADMFYVQLGTDLSAAVQSALAASGTVSATQPGDAAISLSEHPTQHKKKHKSQHKQGIQPDGKSPTIPEVYHGSQQAAEMGASKVEKAVEASAVGKSTAGKAKAIKRVLPSGDDLGDEFSVEIEDAEDLGSKKKKKKSLLNSDLASDAAAAGAGAAAPVKGKTNKHKVVSF